MLGGANLARGPRSRRLFGSRDGLIGRDRCECKLGGLSRSQTERARSIDRQGAGAESRSAEYIRIGGFARHRRVDSDGEPRVIVHRVSRVLRLATSLIHLESAMAHLLGKKEAGPLSGFSPERGPAWLVFLLLFFCDGGDDSHARQCPGIGPLALGTGSIGRSAATARIDVGGCQHAEDRRAATGTT